MLVRPTNAAQIALLETAPAGSDFDHLFMMREMLCKQFNVCD